MAAKVPRQRRARSSDGRGITRKPKPKGSHTTEKQVEKKALTAQNKIRKNPQPEFSQPLASPKPPPAPREVPAHRAAPPAPTSIADGLPKIQPNPTQRAVGEAAEAFAGAGEEQRRKLTVENWPLGFGSSSLLVGKSINL